VEEDVTISSIKNHITIYGAFKIIKQKEKAMKIAVMTSWNDETGASLHSRALVKAWIERGHKVTVFSFLKENCPECKFIGRDERYVIRCIAADFMDPRPILTSDFDIFLVEDLRTLPTQDLAKVFPMIKERARTVHVVHEDKLPKETWFYQFPWDKVIYFDERQDFLKDVYPDAELIPFPCFPVRRGDKVEYRKRLGLPIDRNIIYNFCQRGYYPYLRYMCTGLLEKAVLLFVTSPGFEMVEKESTPPWMIVREEGALSDERFDEYLFASNAVIFHKTHDRFNRYLSSVIYQAIGAGCPIFIPRQLEYFQTFKDEVVYYSDTEDMCGKLEAFFEDQKRVEQVIEAAEVYTRMRSAEKIAEIYIDVFTEVLRGK
jgi:hypothetical protein